MTVAQPTKHWRQALLLFVLVVLPILFIVLAGVDAGMITPGAEKCPPKIPKWFGCVLANHESLSGGLFGAGGALLAAWLAWDAIMAQIESDKELARDAQRAIVHGGPGHRVTAQNGVQTGIVFTGQNTGMTAAFTKEIYWGVCKQAEWPTVSKNWIAQAKQKEWEEVLPPQMKPSERYVVEFTATPVPDDGEKYVCYGKIVYIDLFGRKNTTSWKHLVERVGSVLKSSALPGGYSSEWEEQQPKD
jgi:hypothetical protein